MKRFLKLMIWDQNKKQLSPSMPAVYWKNVTLGSFLRCILPDLNSQWLPDKVTFFSNLSNNSLSESDFLTQEVFDMADFRNTYFHILAVNSLYPDIDRFLENITDSETAEHIRAFLTREPPRQLETLQITATVHGLETNLPSFHSSAMVLLPLSSHSKNTLCIKYADEDSIKMIYADLTYNPDNDRMCLDYNAEGGNLFLYKDICAVNEIYPFGRIVDMIEADEYLYVVHENKNQGIEFKTFHNETQFSNKEQASKQRDSLYRDTGNRIVPISIFSGSRGEQSILYRNILFKTLLEQKYSFQNQKNMPGRLYAMIKNQEGLHTILIWNHETRQAGITTISGAWDLNNAAWLWFTCQDQPKSLAYCKELDTYFLSTEGKGLLFMLENFQGSLLRDVSTLFMDNETEMAANGDVLDLAMGFFTLQESAGLGSAQPFLMVGQQNAISLYYFEVNSNQNT